MPTWRGGRPVDANTAPAEISVYSGVTTVDTGATQAALPLDTVCRSVGFAADADNTGTIYIGPESAVALGNGFPVNAAGISMDINQNTNPIYMVGDGSGDALRWIAIL
jgi:hypothetical protein